jgi:hypothetical protein
MRHPLWIVAIATIAAAHGCGSGTSHDVAADAPSKGPPTGFTFKAIGDGSLASFGWSGALHGVTGPAGTPFSVKATQCADPAGSCAFAGPTPPVDPIDPVNRQRCLNRMSVPCKTDVDCHLDPAHSKHDKCVFIYDAPTASPLAADRDAQGRPLFGACAFTYIPVAAAGELPTISGALDLTSGDLTLTQLTISLQLNGDMMRLRGVCAECVGDPMANDGKKGGHCVKAVRPGFLSDPSPDADPLDPTKGQPCDAHRYGAKGFDNVQYSMDCSPSVTDADNPPTPFGGTFSSAGYKLSISKDSPPCGFPGMDTDKCFCGLCEDQRTGCRSNAECPGAQTCGYLPAGCKPNPAPRMENGLQNPDFNPAYAPGECTGTGKREAQIATRDNFCQMGACTWNEDTGTGQCPSILDGAQIACYPHGDTASIVAHGGARHEGSIYFADTATAACSNASPLASGLNSQLGLPGLIFQRRRFQIFPEYTP